MTLCDVSWTPIRSMSGHPIDEDIFNNNATDNDIDDDLDNDDLQLLHRTELGSQRSTEIISGHHQLEERNLVLRDQVRSLEASLRGADMEIKAAHLCLRDLERELKDKELQLNELKHMMAILIKENETLLHNKDKLDIDSVVINPNHTFPFNELYSKQMTQSQLDITHPIVAMKDLVKSCYTSSQQKEYYDLKLDLDHQLLMNKSSDPPRQIKSPRVKIVSRPHSGAITNLDYSGDLCGSNGLLVSGGYDGYVAVLDPLMLRVSFSLRMALNESAIVIVCISEDKKKILAACLDSAIYIANVEKQKTVSTLLGHQSRITGAGFLTIKNLNGSMNLQEVSQCRQTNCLVHTTHDRMVYSVSLDRSIRIWDIEKNVCVHVSKTISGITGSCFNNGLLAIGYQNGSVALCVVKLESEPSVHQLFVFRPLAPSTLNINPFAIHDDAVIGVCFSMNKEHIFSQGKDGRLTQLVISTRTEGKSFQMPSGFRSLSVNCIPVISPCGNMIVSAGPTGIVFWDTITGHCLKCWETSAATTCLIWKEKLFVSGHTDGSILLWSL